MALNNNDWLGEAPDIDGFGFHPVTHICAWSAGEWRRLKEVKARQLRQEADGTRLPKAGFYKSPMETRGPRLDWFMKRRRAEFLAERPWLSEDEIETAVEAAVGHQIGTVSDRLKKLVWFPPIPESA